MQNEYTMEKIISVIIPVYNGEKYIEKCIDSISNQRCNNLEIIIVDDGSTDKTGMICDQYAEKDKRIRVIHQENVGCLLARAKGVAEAQGIYISFVDADDWIEGQLYDAMMEVVRKTPVDLLITDIEVDFPSGRKDHQNCGVLQKGLHDRDEIEKRIYPSLIWNFETSERGLYPSLCAKLFRREHLMVIYQKLSKSSFFIAEDASVCYAYMLSLQGKVYVLPQCYYHYRGREGGNIPSYKTTDKYFEHVMQVYTFLRSEIEQVNDTWNLKKQLEYHYMWLVNDRKQIYYDVEGNPNGKYLFPFGKIDRGKSIVLYGAGNVGHQYKKQLERTSFCRNIMWVDQNYNNFKDEKVFSPDSICQFEFDYVVIANANTETRLLIKKYLIEMGIDEAKIID